MLAAPSSKVDMGKTSPKLAWWMSYDRGDAYILASVSVLIPAINRQTGIDAFWIDKQNRNFSQGTHLYNSLSFAAAVLMVLVMCRSL